jgi:hypothetical protein
VITMEAWALIQRLAAEGVPHSRIAERLGIDLVQNVIRLDVSASNSRTPPEHSAALLLDGGVTCTLHSAP